MKHENSDSRNRDRSSALQRPKPKGDTLRRNLLILSLVFFTALGVRLLNWYARRDEVAAVQTGVTLNYKHQARLIGQNGFASLFDASSSTNNPDLLGHPLGYPILLATIYLAAPESDTATQLVQVLADSIAAVVICLIALELFPAAISLMAGLMAALAPQFSWNSILLLPDSLAALPILLAALLIVHTRQERGGQPISRDAPSRFPNLLLVIIAGALIGVSVWLRANALLLAPFLLLLFPIIYHRGARLAAALALLAGACLVIAPLTVRNALVFGKFIPVSLGAGQTLIEGLADYDHERRLGLPTTDLDLMRDEAKSFQRPDYATTLFGPDAPARDRARLGRGVAVIRAHPLWFFSVMVQRAASMLRLERTPLRLATIDLPGRQSLFQTPLRILQKLFITAIFLPLTLIGAAILIRQRRFQTLAILLIVPAYYSCVQSALHTEYRYVLVMHYFLFTLASVAVYSISCVIKRALRR